MRTNPTVSPAPVIMLWSAVLTLCVTIVLTASVVWAGSTDSSDATAAVTSGQAAVATLSGTLNIGG